MLAQIFNLKQHRHPLYSFTFLWKQMRSCFIWPGRSLIMTTERCCSVCSINATCKIEQLCVMPNERYN